MVMSMLQPRIVSSIALVGLVSLVFGRVVWYGWVEFDDLLHVVENPNLNPVTCRSLCSLWTHSYEHLFIPLSYSLYAAEAVSARWLADASSTSIPAPWLFHLTSLALHVGAALLVLHILAHRTRQLWAATAGAALFAIHPLQVESVAWISEQRGLLSGVLALVAIDQFVRWSESPSAAVGARLRYGVALLAFVLALLAKPSSIVAPAVAFLLIFDRLPQSRPAALLALGPWWLCAAAVAILTRDGQSAGAIAGSVSPAARAVVAADAIAFYAEKLVSPRALCVAYGRTPQAVLADPATPWVATTVVAAIAALAFIPRLRPGRLPTLLFLVPFVPVLGFVPFLYQNQSTVADRYAYLAMLGPAVALAGWLAQACSVGRGHRLAAATGLACLAALSWQQTGVWRNTGTLAVHAVAIAPGVTGSWTLLSAYELSDGDPRSAVESARRAIEVSPTNQIAWLNLAAGLSRLRQADAAEKAFDQLLRLGMSDAEVATIFYNRGCSALGHAHDEDAAADFRVALARNPRHAGAASNLGVALTRLGDIAGAVEVFRTRLADEPADSAAWVGLGNALFADGRPGEAARCYAESLELEPDDPPTLLNRAAARLAAGDRQGAAADVAAAEAMGARSGPELRSLLEGGGAPP
jgi:Flp pilus assembly protein TadD